MYNQKHVLAPKYITVQKNYLYMHHTLQARVEQNSIAQLVEID